MAEEADPRLTGLVAVVRPIGLVGLGCNSIDIMNFRSKTGTSSGTTLAQGGPSASGKKYVDMKFKVPVPAWVTG